MSGGIGGANVKFYDSGSSTSGLIGHAELQPVFRELQSLSGARRRRASRSTSASIGSSGREINVHYVHNLNQFGRDSVIRYTVWLGYTFGQ